MPLANPINKTKFAQVIKTEEKGSDVNIAVHLLNDAWLNNYECAVIMEGNEVVGITGLWFCTRHYSGKSVELDHVYIKPQHRNKGLGKLFMNWIKTYCREKGYETMELNTYVQNHPSHKFYYNEGFQILGYHFLKKL